MPEIPSDALLISASPGRLRAALLEGGEVVDFLSQDERMLSHAGEIHRARITHIAPDTLDARVQLGGQRLGFLGRENQGGLPLAAGDGLLVQVVRDAAFDKPLGLSATVELSTPHLVLCLQGGDRQTKISRRIAAKAERARLRAWITAHSLAGEFWHLRTAAASASPDLLLQEMARLRAQAHALLTLQGAGPPALLVAAPDVLSLALARWTAPRPGHPAPDAILIDDGALFSRALALAPQLHARLQHAPATGRLLDRAGVSDALADALSPAVAIPEGGRLRIHHTDAFSYIDIDRQGRKGASATVNFAALPVILRQIRLRGLQGLILIDFLRCDDHGQQTALTAAITQRVRADLEGAAIHGFTRAGLFEISRPRSRRDALCHSLKPCASCQGVGQQLDPFVLGLDALEQLVHAGKTRLIAAPAIAETLKRAPLALAQAAARLGQTVTIHADPQLAPNRFEIPHAP